MILVNVLPVGFVGVCVCVLKGLHSLQNFQLSAADVDSGTG